MARFAVPAQPSRSVLHVDRLLGVDMTNDPGNVAKEQSPCGDNMIRDVPGKVRKCMGYQRIAAALREAGIEPATTRNDINTFTMTITKQRTMANSSPGDVVKAIMTVLERHSAMSVKEIMRELQLTPLAATSGMRELMKEGRVARVKFADDPAQRYRLKG